MSKEEKYKSVFIVSIGVIIALFLGMLGNGLAIAESAKVKITRIEGQPAPKIQFETVDGSQIQITDLVVGSACITADYASRYPNYATKATQDAKCMNGYVQGNLLEQKIAGLQDSITDIERLLASLNRTKIYLDSKTNMNGASIVGIPAGIVGPAKFEKAKNVAMKCLVSTANNSVFNISAVGDHAYDSLSLFNRIPINQVTILKGVEAENAVIMSKIAQELVNTKSAEHPNGQLGVGFIINNIAFPIKNSIGVMKGNTIPILLDDLPNYPDVVAQKAYLTLTVNHLGETFVVPKVIVGALKLAGIDIDPVLEVANLGMGSAVFPGAYIPSISILNELKEAQAKHVSRFIKLRDEYRKLLSGYQSALKTLELSNYNCGA